MLSSTRSHIAGMKCLVLFIILFTFSFSNIFSQVIDNEGYRDRKPGKLMLNSHKPNLKSFPEKSFYKQKADWLYIIDTTWGPGLPLTQKQQIFNMLGEELETLVNEEKPAGTYELSWSAANLPSGVYIYRLEAVSTSEQAEKLINIKKMLLIK